MVQRREHRKNTVPATDSDGAWEHFGASDPYFAVKGGDELRQGNLDDKAVQEFFETGQTHLDLIAEQIRTHLGHDFKPKSALDFGCGVGRMLVPLSSLCERVVGVDISEAMLTEAKRQCDLRGISNVEFVISDDALSRVSGKFDFVHCYTVFQHIPKRRGEAIVKRLVDLLPDGGIGAFHFTYSRDATWLRKAVNWGRGSIPFLNNIANLVQGERINLPLTQMNSYDLNLVFRILQEKGCAHSFVSNLPPVGGYYRMILFAVKNAIATSN